MLDVFFTVDVEVWCDGWTDIDQKFPAAFRRYIYGPTPQGEYGLPYKLNCLNDHGLKGVFFVAPLFARRFGDAPLQEITGLIDQAGQETQLHLHAEWADESTEDILPHITRKTQHLLEFSLDDQTTLISVGKSLLNAATRQPVCAFRAGNFSFNRDTLRALRANGFTFDSSYNATIFGLESGVSPGMPLHDVRESEGIYEYPVTVFNDSTGKLRHVQLTACSFDEIEWLLWQALEDGRKSFVILSHNFELLNEAKTRPDLVVVDRFRKLCEFLDKNRDSFNTRGFHGLTPSVGKVAPRTLSTPLLKTAARVVEQVSRWRYR